MTDPIVLGQDVCARWAHWARYGGAKPPRPAVRHGVTVRSATETWADTGSPVGGVVYHTFELADPLTGEIHDWYKTVAIRQGSLVLRSVRDDDILEVRAGALEYTGLIQPGHIGKLCRQLEAMGCDPDMQDDDGAKVLRRLHAIHTTGSEAA